MLLVHNFVCGLCCFFFKQKTAYEMRISDWSSDVCSSDLEDTQLVANTARAKARDSETDFDLVGKRQRGEICAARLGHQADDTTTFNKIGRASCRESVCQYV